MSKGTKYALLFIVIAIIALAIYVGIQEKSQIGDGAKTENTSTNTVGNTVTNNNVENNVNNTNNTIENTNTATPESIVKSTTLSDEEKAKELAKLRWGGSDGVYFAIDTMNSDETYIVSVRDSSTTKVLEWYTVDIKTGTVKN